MITLQASLFSIKKDHEGEVKITFAIPQTDANKAMQIPEQTLLSLNIEAEEGV